MTKRALKLVNYHLKAVEMRKEINFELTCDFFHKDDEGNGSVITKRLKFAVEYPSIKAKK